VNHTQSFWAVWIFFIWSNFSTSI